jgi:hypothetical protein
LLSDETTLVASFVADKAIVFHSQIPLGVDFELVQQGNNKEKGWNQLDTRERIVISVWYCMESSYGRFLPRYLMLQLV